MDLSEAIARERVLLNAHEALLEELTVDMIGDPGLRKRFDATREARRLRLRAAEKIYREEGWDIWWEDMPVWKGGFNASQPRVPAGSAQGGQWAGSSGSSGSAPHHHFDPDRDDPPIEPVYPIESVISLLPAGRATRSLISAARIWHGISNEADTLHPSAQAIEQYLGGKPTTSFSPKGDLTLTRNGKRIRFNIKGPHGYDPHFHVEHEIKPDVWVDVGEHMHFFKGGK